MRILLVVMVLGLAAPARPSEKTVIDGQNAFAVELYGPLRERPGNLFFSPSSVSLALALPYPGARGATADEMRRVLHFSESTPAGYAALLRAWNGDGRRPYELSVAAAAWADRRVPLDPAFLATAARSFGATPTPVDFRNPDEAARQINAWAAARTHNRIPALVSKAALHAAVFVLTSAIFLKAPWEVPFVKELTRREPFHVTPTRAVDAYFMQNDARVPLKVLRTPELQAIELPYQGGQLSLVVLLPARRDGLAALEAKLGSERLAGWLRALAPGAAEVHLPRFTFTSDLELSDTLAKMGMPLAFSDGKSDFTGITPQNLWIAKVLHKAFVSVDEQGTEAAAATAVTMAFPTAVHAPPPVFRADHPFLFLIHDRAGTIHFLGRVVDPTR
jgi:serpin B